MLGHQLCRVRPPKMEFWGKFRSGPNIYSQFNFISTKRASGNICAEEAGSIKKALDRVQPDVVINCIGIVKQRDEAKQAMQSIKINSLFPHQ